ncbi:hypothetical protein BVER_05823c [Candidatus Burkholderia verschuerenii]|uniref:Transmembrane protein n=1 Tax=Candidatus Burkholderia verschuerenii TaxID=242163 RepID=A0A0L0M5A6_9BURK|nr:hypothetical protein [Candidatus Burkholderia verschuerenii]KND57466.1 hypothetical protein BVER_05823c [Candidatus Burkholderia verschuerenii]
MGNSGQLVSRQDYYAKKGIEQGAKSLPPTSAQSLDSYETQLQADAQRIVAGGHAEFSKKQASKIKALAEVESVLSQTSVDCDTLLHDRPLTETVSHTREQQRPVLIRLREDQLQREAELKAYRALNHISEKASYPENLMLPFLWLVPFILGETICNAVLYENAQGLLGGAFVAFLVSIVNLSIAFCMGMAFRYKNLSAGVCKVAGWNALLVAVFVAIYFNAIFSAYRSEYQLLVDPSDLVEAGAAFKRAMSVAGYVFIGRLPSNDLMSFVLFFLGLVLSAIAFWKGYSCDDRHPGHGKRDRLFTEASRKFDSELDVVKLKVVGEIQRRVTGMAAAKNQLLSTKARLDQIRSGIRSDVATLKVLLTELQRDFTLVLNVYRQKNVSVRPIPAPEYFAETPDLICQYAHEDGSALIAQVEAAEQQQEMSKSLYLSQLNDGMRDLENEGRIQQGVALAEFVAEVTREAQKNIDARHRTMPLSTVVSVQA